jgi:tetratricopeptide (TPR) repeat protein
VRDKLFISYSHRDANWLERLQGHLAPYERGGKLEFWDDTRIDAGQHWRTEIWKALAEAKVAVLLVSEHFLVSQFIRDEELPYLLSSAENDGLLVLPAIVGTCAFLKVEALSQYQSINPPSQPLDSLPETDREQYLRRLAATVAEALANTAKSAAHSGATGRLVGVPSRHPLFCGRQDLPRLIEGAFAEGPVVALTGLNGIGKTEIAIEYVYRTRIKTTAVFWVQAENTAAVQTSLVNVARALGLPEATGASEPNAIQAALRWLERNRGWLVVVDDLGSGVDIQPLLRAAASGNTLITSEQPIASLARRQIEIEPLDVDAATELVVHRAGLSGASPVAADADTLSATRRLIEECGGIPLALEQAAAYIEETGCGIAAYVELWSKHRARLLARDLANPARKTSSVSSTWAVALAALGRKSASAVALLKLASFLHHENISEELFSEASDLLGEELGPRVADPIELNELFAALRQFSLLKRDAKTRSLRMHRLVQSFVYDSLSAEERPRLAQQAVGALARCFPEPKFATWSKCERMLPHVLACAQSAPGEFVRPADLGRMLYVAGYYLYQRGHYAPARELSQRALGCWQQANAKIETAQSILVIAQIDQATGKFDSADGYYAQGLDILRGTSPPRPIEVARGENLRAALRLARGDIQGATSGFNESRLLLESSGAADTPEYAQVVNNIGALAFTAGDYPGAEEAFRRSLAIRERTLPPNHPSIAQGYNNVAAACKRQGRAQEAEASYRKALALREDHLGPNHPDVGETLYNLGLLKLDTHALDEAAPCLERALAIQQAARGTEHPDCARTIVALGDLALERREFTLAHDRHQEALRISRAALGPDHPDVARSLVGLAAVVAGTGDRASALELLNRSREIFARRLGIQHADYLDCERRIRELS